MSGLLFVALISTAGLIVARLAPGDYTDTLRAARLDPMTIERERTRLYLDRSLPDLAAIWLRGLVRLDLGESYRFGRPVRDLLLERAPRTVLMITATLLISLGLALLTGTLQATTRGPLHHSLKSLNALGVATPAVVLLFGALVVLGRLNVLATIDLTVAMPFIGLLALALPASGALALVHAQAVKEALAETWATAALARGVPERRLIWRSALRLASKRLISMLPYVTANILSVSLLIEVVTGWAGLGRLTLDAVIGRDIFLVAGCTAVVAALLVSLTSLADLAAGLLDPRIDAVERSS